MIIDSPLEVKLYTKESVELPSFIKNRFLRAQSVYQPENDHDIQQMYSIARKNKLAIIPRGAATSIMGEITPLKKSMIADLTHLKGILDFDEVKRTITVEAGIRWWELMHFLKKHTLDPYTYPTSLFSTVGGWLSTGGYGINSLKYGHISSLVDSIEVVTPERIKTVNRGDREFKYFIGTEGQMGIITKVKLKLREAKPLRYFLVYFQKTSQVIEFLTDVMNYLKALPIHISFFDRSRLEHKNLLLDGKISFPRKEGVLIAFEDDSSEKALLNLMERKQGILAEDYLTSFLWNERFFPFSLKLHYPSILGCEAILPLEKLDHYISLSRRFGANHHLPLSTEATLISKDEAVVFTIFPSDSRNLIYPLHLFLIYSLNHIAMRCGGRPYGIGMWNLPLLKKSFPDEELKEYRRFKRLHDPLNLLNPAKSLSKDSEITYLLKFVFTVSAMFSNGIPLLKPFLKILGAPKKEINGDLPDAESCANCGACTVVCPAYLMNKTEVVTAKGKLFLLKSIFKGSKLPRSTAEKIFQCLHCHLCEHVCQSKLILIPAWEKLESLLEKKYGRPTEQIEEFIKKVESDPAYTELLDSFSLSSNNDHRELQNV